MPSTDTGRTLTCCHGINADTPAIAAKHPSSTEAVAHRDVGDIRSERWESVGGQQGARGTEDIGGLLALLPLGSAVLEPDL